MSSKKLAGVTVFLIGSFIGASTQTDIWDKYPFWIWFLILLIALAVCGLGVNLWRSDDKKET